MRSEYVRSQQLLLSPRKEYVYLIEKRKMIEEINKKRSLNHGYYSFKYAKITDPNRSLKTAFRDHVSPPAISTSPKYRSRRAAS